MAEKFVTLDKLIRSKQMAIFLILMAVISVLFAPVLGLKRKKALELQESIKVFNRGRLGSFGGSSLGRVE